MNPIVSEQDVSSNKNFRFFDNRQKYLLFVNTCSEKEIIAKRVGMELRNIRPNPPARCRKRNDTFSPNDARRAPLAHLTSWPICKVFTTYKLRTAFSCLISVLCGRIRKYAGALKVPKRRGNFS